MKNFIIVTTTSGIKNCINVEQISYFYETANTTKIYLADLNKVIEAKEKFQKVCDMIVEATNN